MRDTFLLTSARCFPYLPCSPHLPRQQGYKERATLSLLAKTLFMQLVLEPKVQELINKCIYNGHTWHCESLSNLAHMYQPKRTHFGPGQQNLMILAKLDMNEQRVTRYVTGYTKREKKTGMRRLAQNNSVYFEPRHSPKTNFFRQEALQRLHLELVDRDASLPLVPWPAASAPVAVVPPQPRSVVGQLPIELQSRRVVPTQKASIIGPLVGARGSLHELVLKQQPRDWRESDAKQPRLPPPLTPAAVSVKLAEVELQSVVLCCPSCNTLLSAALPEGVTQVRCDSCSAAPLHTMVAPSKEERKRGRRNPSHHAPPFNPKQAGRAPTAFNRYMSNEMRSAGDKPSRESFSQAARNWPAARDAAASLTAAACTARSGQPRRAARAPAAAGGAAAQRQQRGRPARTSGGFYQDSSDEEEEASPPAAPAATAAASSARFGESPPRFVLATLGRKPVAPFAQPDGPAAAADVEMEYPSPPASRGSVRDDTGMSAGQPAADGSQPDSASKASSAQRPSKGARSVIRCRNCPRELVKDKAPKQLSCDGGCGQPIQIGASIYACEDCDFDMCEACAAPRARRGRTRSVNFGDAPAAHPGSPSSAGVNAPAACAAAAPRAAAPAAPDVPDAPRYDAKEGESRLEALSPDSRARVEADMAADMAQYVAPMQAAADTRRETRRVLGIQAEARAETLMDNGVVINEALRRRYGPSEAQE